MPDRTRSARNRFMKRSLLAPLITISFALTFCLGSQVHGRVHGRGRPIKITCDFFNVERESSQMRSLIYSDFIKKVKNMQVISVLIDPDKGIAYIEEIDGNNLVHRAAVYLAPDPGLIQLLTDNDVPIAVKPTTQENPRQQSVEPSLTDHWIIDPALNWASLIRKWHSGERAGKQQEEKAIPLQVTPTQFVLKEDLFSTAEGFIETINSEADEIVSTIIYALDRDNLSQSKVKVANSDTNFRDWRDISFAFKCREN